MYYQVVFFIVDHHTFKDAQECGAVHSTSSTIDAVSGHSGFYDIAEVVDTCVACLGIPVNVGVINKSGAFVSFNYIYRELSAADTCDEVSDIIESFGE